MKNLFVFTVAFTAISLAAFADDFLIDTAVTDTNGGAIVNGGDRIEVSGTGSVTTTLPDISGYGLYGSGQGNTYFNHGIVSTTGNHTRGIYNGGANGVLINEGTILTGGYNAWGIFSSGNDSAVTNGGRIITTGSHAIGILVSRFSNNDFVLNGTVTNSGTIETSGEQAIGIVLQAANGLAINGGVINISGGLSAAMIIDGADNTAINSRSINTFSDRSIGIHNQSANAIITNSGTITTNGQDSMGINNNSTGTNTKITNSGTITTEGINSAGIQSRGNNAVLANSGAISITGDSANGIDTTGSNGLITNNGTISTTGARAYGIIHRGADSTIVNSKAVTVYGLHSVGILNDATNGTLINSGTVSSNGTGSFSLFLGGYNATLILNKGSVLIGDIGIFDPSSAALHFGRGLNTVVKTNPNGGAEGAGVPNTITAPRNAYVVDGNLIYAFDTTGFGAGARASANAAGLVFDALANRQFGVSRNANIFLSTKGKSTGQSWGQFIGGGLYQPATTTTIAYGALAGGFVVGREQAQGEGYFGGLSLGRVASSSGTGFETSTIGAFGGIYRTLGNGRDLAVSLGYINNDNKRTVAGIGGVQTASATYGSVLVNVTLTEHDAFGSNGTDMRLRYAGSFSQGYTETGSSSNMTVKAQNSHMIELRTQQALAVTQAITLLAGVDVQYTLGSNTSLTVASKPLSVTSANNGFSGRGFLGMDFTRKSDDNLRGNIEVGFSDTGRIDATLALKWTF